LFSVCRLLHIFFLRCLVIFDAATPLPRLIRFHASHAAITPPLFIFIRFRYGCRFAIDCGELIVGFSHYAHYSRQLSYLRLYFFDSHAITPRFH
jgi:hypothetical protein